MRRCLSDLIKHKERLVEEIDIEIEKIKADVKKCIERYFHNKYLLGIEYTTCNFNVSEDIYSIVMDVYYSNRPIMYFYLYKNCSNIFEHESAITHKIIKNMQNKKNFKLIKLDMIRIYEKYTQTYYLQNLPKAVTLTLCNQHRRIFPKDILNLIIKKLF